MRKVEGMIFTTQNGFVPGRVVINNEVIQEIEYFDSCDQLPKETQKVKIIPGLIDIHLHGANGHDFCEGSLESIIEIEKYEKQHGIICFCMATMTLNKERISKICEVAGKYVLNKEDGLCGIYLEGPFVSGKKSGAQNKDYLQIPNTNLIDELNECSKNKIKYVVIAPELENGIDVIKDISEKEIKVSLGHTDADYDISKKAYNAGAKHITHMFNAMKPFNHRAPGICGYALDNDDIEIEVIADGVHLHESVVRMLFRIKNDDKIILVSDSTMATGLDDGKYYLGDKDIFVEGRKSTLSDGTIAGSVTNLYDCMVSAIKMGVNEAAAIKAATINPAKSIGISDFYGSIECGKSGKILLIDNQYNLLEVIGDAQ